MACFEVDIVLIVYNVAQDTKEIKFKQVIRNQKN